jgi:hypothetical protein
MIGFGALIYLFTCVQASFIYHARLLSLPKVYRFNSNSGRTRRPVGHRRLLPHAIGGSLIVAAIVLLLAGFWVLLALWQSRERLFDDVTLTAGGILKFIFEDSRFLELTVLLIAGGSLVWIGFWLLEYGRRVRISRAEEVMGKDPRPPILIIRSFRDDMMRVERDSDGMIEKIRRLTFSRGMVFEEAVEAALKMFGPVSAIGRPGESLAPLGAPREYIGNSEDWIVPVTERMSGSSIVALLLGATGSLKDEIEKLVELDATSKVLVVFPPVAREKLSVRWGTVKVLLNINDNLVDEQLARKSQPAAILAYAVGQSTLIVGDSTKDTSYREAIIEGARRIVP